MKIEITSDEVKEALLPYLEQFFTKPIKDIYDLDVGCISMEIEFGSEDDNEPEEIQQVKRKRTRKKEVQLDLVEEIKKQEVKEQQQEEEIGTHYANLPKLNQEEQTQYVNLLELLSNNARNKNRLAIEELISSGSENLKTVAKANEHYQDWLKYCEEQDIQQAQKEMTSEPEITEEPEDIVQEVETIKSDVDLMKEVMEELPDEPVNEPKPLFANNPTVAKTGSFFSANAGKRVF